MTLISINFLSTTSKFIIILPESFLYRPISNTCRKHPHKDFEIFTYVVNGAIYHTDSMGNKEGLPRGCVQYLSAGTGIWHSETNEGDELLRSLQFWV